MAEHLLAGPSALLLVVFAAAEGAGLGAAEALERSYAGFMEHVAAAEDHLQKVRTLRITFAREGVLGRRA